MAMALAMNDEYSAPAHVLVGRFGTEEHGYALVFADHVNETQGAIWLSPSNAAPFILVSSDAFVEGLCRVARETVVQCSASDEYSSWVIRRESDGIWIFAGPSPGQYVAGILILPDDQGPFVECVQNRRPYGGAIH